MLSLTSAMASEQFNANDIARLPQSAVTDIKQYCAARWSSNYEMREYCENEQYAALKRMIERGSINKPNSQADSIKPNGQAMDDAVIVVSMSLILAKCIAPEIDTDKEKDFNYFSDAMWALGRIEKALPVSKSEIQKAAPKGDEIRKYWGAEFCVRGKKLFDGFVADARRDHMEELLFFRAGWAGSTR